MKNVLSFLAVISVCFILCINNGFSQMQSDTSDNYWEVVLPLSASQDIDMKQVLLSEQKDSLVSGFIRNTGSWKFRVDSIYFRGADASAFSLVSGFPVYTIEASQNKAAEFRFTPNRVGVHNAEIVIITQADTLYQTIRGEGVKPELAVLNEIIDFGAVNLGSFKDTVYAATVVNAGYTPLEITMTRHGGPNDKDFKTISGGAPITLQSGDTARMNLRFTPSFTGRTMGTLEFHYDNPFSPLKIQLFGEGIGSPPKIEMNDIFLKDIICENFSSDELLIRNTGGTDLEIRNIYITGNYASDFSFSPPAPFTIMPDSVQKILIEFRPQSTGIKEAELHIESNADNQPQAVIKLKARKDSAGFFTGVDYIEMGYLCPGESRDTSFIVINRGSKRNTFFITSTDNLEAEPNRINLFPNYKWYPEIRLKNTDAEGEYTEKVIVRDSICGYEKEILVHYIVETPKIEIKDIQIIAKLNSPKEAFIEIENKSGREVSVTSVSQVSPPWEIPAGQLPLVIPPKEMRTLKIVYTPADENEDELEITLNGKPCGFSASGEITGIPGDSRLTIKAGGAEAKPGEVFYIPIILVDKNKLEITAVTGLKTDLSYNASMFYPVDLKYTAYENGRAFIHLDSLPADVPAGTVLDSIRCIAALGNAVETQLILENSAALGDDIEVRTIDGIFSLKGLCHEGGTRLVNTENKMGILSFKPNPAENELTVEVNFAEKGMTGLYLYNGTGGIAKEIFTGNIETAEIIEFTVSLNDISPGAYFLIFRSPSYRETHPLMIVK